MEFKNIFPKNMGTLLLNKLYAKKNWFIISFAILIITVVILPMLIIQEIRDENIIIGFVEIFVIVFINCMKDFNYLHDSRKLSYYVSKPITNIQNVNLNIITNLIFAAVLLAGLFIIGLFPKFDIFEMYIVGIPWLIVGIFVAALSSVLTGNTITASISTIINFTLPLSFLAIIYFIFDVMEEIALGFNSNIMINKFIENYYRIDYLYLIKYADKGIKFPYFVIIFVVIAFVFIITNLLLQRRKNERAGEFIVYDGFKNLISVLVGSLVPIWFLTVFNRGSFASKIISFIILSALAYYIIIAILEKSFQISRNALKVFAIFIAIFFLILIGANVATNSYEGYVPEAKDVHSVYLGQNTWIRSNYNNEGINAYELDKAFVDRAKDVPVYSDDKNIQNIIDLHEEIIKDQSYISHQGITITYILKNGDNVTRKYDLLPDENYDGNKDRLLKGLINTDEFKIKRLNFIYGDSSKNMVITNVRIETPSSEINTINLDANQIDIDYLRSVLRKDYDNYFEKVEDTLRLATFYNLNNYYYEKNRYREIEIKNGKYIEDDVETEEVQRYNINITTYKNENNLDFAFDDRFVNTIGYIEKVISDL